MASNLRQSGGDSRVQRVVFVLYKESADAAEVYRSKKIFKVAVEYVPLIPMPCGIGHDRSVSGKSVRLRSVNAGDFLDFFLAVLQ